MTKTEFSNIIRFCVLMENNAGILDKAPRYVIEKWYTKDSAALDPFNTRKVTSYLDRWKTSIDGLED